MPSFVNEIHSTKFKFVELKLKSNRRIPSEIAYYSISLNWEGVVLCNNFL